MLFGVTGLPYLVGSDLGMHMKRKMGVSVLMAIGNDGRKNLRCCSLCGDTLLTQSRTITSPRPTAGTAMHHTRHNIEMVYWYREVHRELLKRSAVNCTSLHSQQYRRRSLCSLPSSIRTRLDLFCIIMCLRTKKSRPILHSSFSFVCVRT